MSAYFRDDPDQLRLCLASLASQTLPPQEIVIVLGGTLPPRLAEVLDEFANSPTPIKLRVIQQQTNEGLGSALQLGLAHCACEFVARMDGDDLCRPERIEKQHAFMMAHPDIDILCSWHEEFESDPAAVNALKCTPQTNEEISGILWWRNVISHPTLFFRRSRVLAIGGYRSMRRSEDQDLYLRAVRNGLKFAAIQQPLLLMRVDRSQRVRRTGAAYAFTSVAWRAQMWWEGNITFPQFLISAPLYFAFHFVPARSKDWLYSFVRKSPAHAP